MVHSVCLLMCSLPLIVVRHNTSVPPHAAPPPPFSSMVYHKFISLVMLSTCVFRNLLCILCSLTFDTVFFHFGFQLVQNCSSGLSFFNQIILDYLRNSDNWYLLHNCVVLCQQTQTVSELKDFVKKLHSLHEMDVSIICIGFDFMAVLFSGGV